MVLVPKASIFHVELHFHYHMCTMYDSMLIFRVMQYRRGTCGGGDRHR
jgi:hypothetical protein